MEYAPVPFCYNRVFWKDVPMIATLRSTGAILALAWMAHAAQPAAPRSWAVAVADSIMTRNPGVRQEQIGQPQFLQFST